MDYEKGIPRNLVQFSEYNDLAFTDTGVSINDASAPNSNVLWSSEKIEQVLRDALGGNAPPNQNQNQTFVQRNTLSGGVNVNPHAHTATLGGPAGSYIRVGAPHFRFGMPRFLKPTWLISWIIPSREHYCEKCCNYMEHKWASRYKDNATLNNFKCNCPAKCACAPNVAQQACTTGTSLRKLQQIPMPQPQPARA